MIAVEERLELGAVAHAARRGRRCGSERRRFAARLRRERANRRRLRDERRGEQADRGERDAMRDHWLLGGNAGAHRGGKRGAPSPPICAKGTARVRRRLLTRLAAEHTLGGAAESSGMVASLPTSRRSSGLAPRELHESSRLLRDPFLRIADEEHGATTGSGESTDQQALDVARASHLRTLMDIRLKPLREQSVVITGASSGIGLVTAKRAAKAGARVVLAARNEHDLASAVASIREDGGRALALRMEARASRPSDFGHAGEAVEHRHAVVREVAFTHWNRAATDPAGVRAGGRGTSDSRGRGATHSRRHRRRHGQGRESGREALAAAHRQSPWSEARSIHRRPTRRSRTGPTTSTSRSRMTAGSAADSTDTYESGAHTRRPRCTRRVSPSLASRRSPRSYSPATWSGATTDKQNGGSIESRANRPLTASPDSAPPCPSSLWNETWQWKSHVPTSSGTMSATPSAIERAIARHRCASR